MPDKCCIVRCKTNYIDGQNNSVFYLPQDEEFKKKWIRFVNRKNWTPTKHSVICAEHFSDDLIISHKKKSLLEWSSSPVPSIYLTKNSSLPPPQCYQPLYRHQSENLLRTEVLRKMKYSVL